MASVAGRAHGVATKRELLDAGLSRKEIEHRARTGALIRVHPGVYRVGHRAPSVEATYLAAVKACGKDAKLSGAAAAHLFRLTRGPAPPPEVTCPTERDVAGVITHRTRRRLGSTTWRGIAVIAVPEVLLEMAGTHSFDDLAYACHQARVLHHTNPEHGEAVLARHPSARGVATLRAILHGDAPTLLSRLEKAFRKLLRDNGLPLPQTNRPAGSSYVDCRWPDHALTVELDSYRSHPPRHAFELDRRREREAYARGDQFRRYTYGDVTETPAIVLEELTPLLPTPAPPDPDRRSPRRSTGRRPRAATR